MCREALSIPYIDSTTASNHELLASTKHIKTIECTCILADVCCVASAGMRRPARDARSSRKSIIRPPMAGSAEEADVGAQLRPSKVGFKKKSAMRQVSTKEEPDQDALQRSANLGRSSRKSMHMAIPAASNAEQEAEATTAGDVESVPAGGFGPRISVGQDSDAGRSQRVSAKARQSIKPPKDSVTVHD